MKNIIQFSNTASISCPESPEYAGAPDPRALSAAMITGIRKTGIDVLPWTRALRTWQARVMPLQLHLLSPAGHPAQITRDLAGFWRNSYPAVKKELKGRYPKHYWPDDPLNAKPTDRVKPRP